MFFKKAGNTRSKASIENTDGNNLDDLNMEVTSQNIKAIIGKSKDIKFRQIYINENRNLPVIIIYIEGLINTSYISDYILKPLAQEPKIANSETPKGAIRIIQEGAVYFSSQRRSDKIHDVIHDILDGNAALVFDSEKTALTFDTKGFEKRSITEPSGENVIKGSKDSFVETLRVNTATIRRKVKTHNLVIEESTIGKQTLTSVAVIYIDSLTNRNIVEEVRNRLDAISIDNVLTTAFIEEHIIKSNKYTTFPQVVYTERPDKFCSNIIEGRVGIIIDGIPSAIILPGTFLQFLQAPEDYSQNYVISSLIRFLRYILMLATLFLPGFYISVTTFHHEMMPTELAISIEASKEGVPFPSFVEVIFMLIAFEILVEAGLRLPRNIGQAVSIVGAVIVGQAAVSAKLVSPAVVVIIAITAIASFTMPNQDFSNALRLWRFITVVLSSIIGLFGLSIGVIILLYHLCKIEVFDIPYLSPFVAGETLKFPDTLFRLPISLQRKRPVSLKTTNKKRQN